MITSSTLDTLIDEQGLSENDARKIAARELLPKYTSSMMKRYREIMYFVHRIEGSPTHEKIQDAIEKNLISGSSYDKALTRAVRSSEDMFETLLEDEDDFQETDDNDSD